MSLVRYLDNDGDPRVGLPAGTHVHRVDVPTMAELLQLSLAEITDLVDRAAASDPDVALADTTLLAPVDGRTEVWGAGVTYLRSRAARIEESRHDLVYHDVYDAVRPELFYKAPAWRVRTDGEAIGIRPDCTDTVAEPELALVLNSRAEIVGALVCDDVTARSVEAQNPIYLPQAKCYAGSCALSTEIVPWWTISAPEDLAVLISVYRDGEPVFAGEARTSKMKRTYQELVDWLFRAEEFPDGAVLSTGTGIVPELGAGLSVGDVVTVTVEQVGTLTNKLAWAKP